MNIRFYNGLICTMEQGVTMEPGEVWVEGSCITYAGPPVQGVGSFERQVDLGGNLLMPGFKNAHTHSAMTFLRSYADDLPLLDWLEQQVFPLEVKLTEQDVYWLSKLAIMEYLTSGITANFDMYMYTDAIAAASVSCGFRTVLCGGISDLSSNCEELEAAYDKFNGHHELIGMQLGFHAEYTSSPGILRELSDLAHRKKSPVFCHNSESLREVQQCMARTGMTPTAWIDSFGLYDFGGGGFHCVHMTNEDLSILQRRGAAVITNPGSNVKLASGVARVMDMHRLGIPVALGTDGPASNNCLDFFREMFLVTGLQKLAQNDAAALSATDVLHMACVTGARIMGLHDCDSLKVGKKADLIVVDLQQPNMQPQNNTLKNIVYSGSKQNIKLTMVNGEILYEKGEFFVGDEASTVYNRANEIITRLAGTAI